MHARTPFVLCCAPMVCAACWLAGTPAFAQHQDLFVGHSPPDPEVSPTPENPCPTLFPLKLFVADNAVVGGAIPPGGGAPADPGAVVTLNRLPITSPLTRPEFGGFVYFADQPGLNFIAPSDVCHGMSTSFTGGQSFIVSLARVYWPGDLYFGMTEPFGTAILMEDGDSWTFGDSANGGHQHPLFLARRAGRYAASFRLTSNRFLTSDEFSLSYEANPACVEPVPLDISGAFNADAVDSDLADAPTPFDGAGRYWVLNGLYGTTRGLPANGRLDVFQLGGPSGARLAGTNLNCIFDNAVLSSAAAIDMVSSGLAANYQSMEMLIAASGVFTSSDILRVHLGYNSGAEQVVNIRRATTAPRFLPILDWQVTTSPIPLLSMGPSGDRDGGGFVRSAGSGIDAAPSPPDSFYMQRVTFTVDVSRVLQSVAFDDYTGAGRVGIFAVTVMRADICRDGDADDDGDVDADDFAMFFECYSGPAVDYGDPDCAVFDADRDDDVDLTDAGAFQVLYTGP